MLMNLWGFVRVTENCGVKLRMFTNSKQGDGKLEPWKETGHFLIKINWIELWHPGNGGNSASGSTVHKFHDIKATRLVRYLETQVHLEMWMGTKNSA